MAAKAKQLMRSHFEKLGEAGPRVLGTLCPHVVGRLRQDSEHYDRDRGRSRLRAAVLLRRGSSGNVGFLLTLNPDASPGLSECERRNPESH